MEIQQAFSFWLDRTARLMKYFASSKAKELSLGITIDQWVILALINQTENISQTRLVDKSFKDKASIARISDILEKSGYIERNRNPENRREYRMKCTKLGKLKVEALLPYVQQARNIGIEGFEEEELVLLISFLQRIYQNYENAIKKIHDDK